MNKILVKIYFPLIEEKYDIWLPLNKTIYNIIVLLNKTVNGLNDFDEFDNVPLLYNKYTGVCYDINAKVKNTDIMNGTELIFI